MEMYSGGAFTISVLVVPVSHYTVFEFMSTRIPREVSRLSDLGNCAHLCPAACRCNRHLWWRRCDSRGGLILSHAHIYTDPHAFYVANVVIVREMCILVRGNLHFKPSNVFHRLREGE